MINIIYNSVSSFFFKKVDQIKSEIVKVYYLIIFNGVSKNFKVLKPNVRKKKSSLLGGFYTNIYADLVGVGFTGFISNFFKIIWLVLSNYKFFSFKKVSQTNSTYSNFLLSSDRLPYGDYMFGFRSFINLYRYALLPLIFCLVVVFSLISMKSAGIFKFLMAWFCVFFFYYLLISGFVFFFKKYRFSKFTGAIQRFWKRSFIIFWSLELFLFAIYAYLLFNSNYEPFYIYDNAQVFKTHLVSFRSFFFKVVFIYFIVVVFYSTLMSLRYTSSVNLYPNVILCTFVLLLAIWQEFYQFFYIISFYSDISWIYDLEDHSWYTEKELKRTRIPNHYTHVFLILKFWHLIFILIFWFFTISHSIVNSRFRYPTMGALFQNLLIFYCMYWLIFYPNIKYILSKFMCYQYYWFFTNTNKFFMNVFFLDFSTYLGNLFTWFKPYTYSFNYSSFFYFIESSELVQFGFSKKSYLNSFSLFF